MQKSASTGSVSSTYSGINTHNNPGDNLPFFALQQPLESMPREGQMRIAHLGAFPALASHFGSDHQRLLERHDINPQHIQRPDELIACTSFTSLLEDCSSRFNDPLFGIRLAQLHEPDVYGCVIALCRSAPTMREAINSFIKYIRITHSPASVMELVEGKHTAEYRWFVSKDLGCNQQANFLAALLMTKLLRQFGGPQFQPHYVNLAVDIRHRDFTTLEGFFGCGFHRTTADNAIAFPREFLDRRIPSASRLLFTLLSSYLDQVKASQHESITQKVANYIRGTLSSGHCCIEHCAQRLGMAVRTLQSKLSEANSEFSVILEEQRIELAHSYLKQPQLTLDEVAANLGYAEQSSFGRAFKRWTGISPGQFRRRQITEG